MLLKQRKNCCFMKLCDLRSPCLVKFHVPQRAILILLDNALFNRSDCELYHINEKHVSRTMSLIRVFERDNG